MRLSDFRALIPSWLFFDDIGSGCELWIRSGKSEATLGEWRKPFVPIPRRTQNLIHNPKGNLRLYVLSNFERLLLESQEHLMSPESFERAEVYAQCLEHVKAEVGGEAFCQFRIVARLEDEASIEPRNREDAFVSRVHKV